MNWIILAVIVFCIFLIGNVIYGFSRKSRFAVLMYHSVAVSQKSDLTVLQSELEKQFNYLKDNKYETVFYDEIAPGKKQVFLTFDDGYTNNKDLLLPLLIKYGFKATIFIPFKYLGKNDEWWTNSQPIMSAGELKNLNSKYIQLGWHSFVHDSFKTLSTEAIREDFRKSAAVISDNNLEVQPIFAYPFGNFPKEKEKQKQLFDVFREFGIQQAFRIGNKLNSLPVKNPFLIKRIDIKGTDSLKVFSWKLRYGRVKPF